jgi:hypothetical protein
LICRSAGGKEVHPLLSFLTWQYEVSQAGHSDASSAGLISFTTLYGFCNRTLCAFKLLAAVLKWHKTFVVCSLVLQTLDLKEYCKPGCQRPSNMMQMLEGDFKVD